VQEAGNSLSEPEVRTPSYAIAEAFQNASETTFGFTRSAIIGKVLQSRERLGDWYTIRMARTGQDRLSGYASRCP
jgi:hypothetical protein